MANITLTKILNGLDSQSGSLGIAEQIKMSKDAESQTLVDKLGVIDDSIAELEASSITTSNIGTWVGGHVDDSTIEFSDSKIKVKDGGVTEGKLSQEVQNKLNSGGKTYTGEGGVTVSGTVISLTDSGVTTNKIALSAVKSSNISASAITTVKIANSAVTEAKVADGAITSPKINVLEYTVESAGGKHYVGPINPQTPHLDRNGLYSIEKILGYALFETGTTSNYPEDGHYSKNGRFYTGMHYYKLLAVFEMSNDNFVRLEINEIPSETELGAGSGITITAGTINVKESGITEGMISGPLMDLIHGYKLSLSLGSGGVVFTGSSLNCTVSYGGGLTNLSNITVASQDSGVYEPTMTNNTGTGTVWSATNYNGYIINANATLYGETQISATTKLYIVDKMYFGFATNPTSVPEVQTPKRTYKGDFTATGSGKCFLIIPTGMWTGEPPTIGTALNAKSNNYGVSLQCVQDSVVSGKGYLFALGHAEVDPITGQINFVHNELEQGTITITIS